MWKINIYSTSIINQSRILLIMMQVENERARNNVSIDKNHTISCASVKRLNCNLPSGTHIYFNRYQGDGVNQLGSWFRKETLSIALEVSINR